VDGEARVKPIVIAREGQTEAYVANGLTGTESIITGEAVNTIKPGDRVEPKR
jgi:hypothetical protein